MLRAADVTAVANGDYSLTVWETDDGLPHNSVAAMVQSSDGFLWIATQAGLVRFDGLEFKSVQSPLLGGIRSSSITSLIAEDADTLLLASTQSGLIRLRHGTLSVHPLNAQLASRPKIQKLFREAENVFWVVFSDREAWRWDHGAVEKFAPPVSARATWTVSFARDKQGDTFLARGAGLERYQRHALTRVPKSPVGLMTIASSAGDGIWVATGHKLVRFGTEELATAPQAWQGGMPPIAMFEDRNGALWLAAFEQGLVLWQHDTATVIPISHVNVADLCDDNEGNLWIATMGGGLNRIQPTRLGLVASDPDWIDTISGTVCEDTLGNVWFANRKGVRKIGHDHIEVMNIASDWPKRAMPVNADLAGNIWFGVDGNVYRAPANDRKPPVLVDSDSSSMVRVIYTARDNSVWIGRNAGPLVRFRPDGTKESFDTARGYGGRRVRTIGEDAQHDVWIGTEEGRLFEYREGRVIEPYADGGLPGHAIRAMLGDAEGHLWIGTAGAGLLVRTGDKLARISTNQGLPDDVISQILEDDYGWLWCGTRRGIFKVQKRALLDCAEATTASVTPTSYGRADGLSGISAVGSYEPTAWKTRSGQLLFVTRKGLVRTDPARDQGERPPPSVYIDDVLADERAIPRARARISSAVRKLEFHFTAPTYVSPERVRYRYRIEGFDADWIDGGTQRLATYPSLPPGNYRFAVEASNGEQAWNPQAATFALTVLPQWWETWWARLAILSLAVSSLVILVRYWSHRRLKARLARLEQEQKIEQERIRIARNLHDDLGASLTHASMMAEELAEDWTELGDPKKRSAELAERVRLIARDLDAVVWTVSPKNDSLASLGAYLSHFAQEYFQPTSIVCHVQIASDIPPVPLSPEVRHHLFMIAKELFSNVVKHSQASRVEVTMQMAAGLFELVVADDGHGFSLAEAERSGRNGLLNLRSRAAETGGALDITSTAKGTVATLQFRLLPDAGAQAEPNATIRSLPRPEPA